MKLWVRSQDKSFLGEVTHLQVIGDSIYCYVNQDLINLGEYANKERCIEVLDEIQESMLDNSDEYENHFGEMPQE